MGIETVASTVLHAFSARAAEAPNRTAVLSRDASLTYGELDARSNRVARALIARGVAPGSLVPVEAVRSADFL
ncbi:hypothetical protein CA831_06115, partial [Burkholderia multivorans]